MKLYIKYMVSTRCKMVVKEELKKLGLHFIVVDLGEIDIMENISSEQREQLRVALHTSGLELMDDKKAVLIEREVVEQNGRRWIVSRMIHGMKRSGVDSLLSSFRVDLYHAYCSSK